VLEILEFDFLTFKSCKNLENSHIHEKVVAHINIQLYDTAFILQLNHIFMNKTSV